jgi:hypothetical protein
MFVSKSQWLSVPKISVAYYASGDIYFEVVFPSKLIVLRR